nr:acyl-protein synthase [Amycolatopsis sp. SID8362]
MSGKAGSDYFATGGVPDRRLASVEKLCELAEPYAHSPQHDGLFRDAMDEVNQWHAENSAFFKGLLRRKGSPSLADGLDLAALPFVHADVFKSYQLLSVSRQSIVLELTSSGTTGRKSRMFFDDWSIRSAQRMVARIFDHLGWLSASDEANYLLYGYEPSQAASRGSSFTGNYLCDFAPRRSVEYALRDDGTGHSFDFFGCVRALQRFAEDGVPARIFGFPTFLHATIRRMRALGLPALQLPAGSLVFLGGGWPERGPEQIRKAVLYREISEYLGIPAERVRDCYGAVEHWVPYVECRNHQLHVPVWARVLIRSVATLEPLPAREVGYLQLISPYVTSVPAQSVLMTDLAAVFPAADCGCEWNTPWFVVYGRAGVGPGRSFPVVTTEFPGDKE